MGRTIEDIDVVDVEKRKIPSKHYVYIIHVTWSDGSTNEIYRRYSRFFDFQTTLMDMFPEDAGALDPQKRIIPFLPGKKFFGRSHIREVAIKRMAPIAEYCKSIVRLPRRISQCKDVIEFFEVEPEDIDPPKGRKASMKASKISKPKPLEVYVAVSSYTKQEKGEVTLTVGTLVEVVEKSETGWWFVNIEEEQGWVPATCLEREDGIKEESTVRLPPGHEEQYMCTEEFNAQGPDEVSMERGAVVDVLEKNLEGWWRVRYGGQEGMVPATFLIKTASFKIPKKAKKGREEAKISGGPQIVKSLLEVSDLLKDDASPVSVPMHQDPHQDVFDDDDDDAVYEPVAEEDEVYSVQELSRILKENRRGHAETDKVYESIQTMKSRSLKRCGSTRPPPRPSTKPKKSEATRPVRTAAEGKLERGKSVAKDFVTIAPFSDVVGDGISFDVGQAVKVLEKSEGGWWYVEISGREGWAPATYIEECSTVTRRSPATVPAQTQDGDSPRRQSAVEMVGGLASALKAKLQPKGGRSPPTPPRKDFLQDNGHVDATAAGEMSGTHAGESPSATRPACILGPGSKPAGRKVADRSQQPPPPAPPVKSDNKPVLPSVTTKPVLPSVTTKPVLPSVTTKPVVPSVTTKPVVPSVTPKPVLPSVTAKLKPPTPGKPKSPVKPSTAAKPKSELIDSGDEEGKMNVSELAGALKAKFEGVEKPKPKVTHKPDSSPPKPVVMRKPVAAVKPGLPSKPTTHKPHWVKEENEDNCDSRTKNSDLPSNNVSGLASVLKAKFESRQSSSVADVKPSGDSTTGGNHVGRPALKPGRPAAPITPHKPGTSAGSPSRPAVPVTPHKPGTSAGSPSRPALRPGTKKLDPDKYSSRPLPPSPRHAAPDTTTPLPSVPVKPSNHPKPGSMPATDSSDSDSDTNTANVSNIANALKAKLASKDTKPLPKKQTPNAKPMLPSSKPLNADIENNNNTKEDVISEHQYVAIADFVGGNEGELELVVGQQVTLLESADSWAYVSSGDIEGWVPALYLEKMNVSTHREPDTSVKSTRNQSAGDKTQVFSVCSDFIGENEGELTIVCGEEVQVLEQLQEGWWFVQSASGEGWVPAAYIQQT